MRRRINRKSAVVRAVWLGLLVIWLSGCRIETPAQHFAASEEDGAVIGAVTLTIACRNAPEAYRQLERELLPPTETALWDGDTVYTLLARAARAAGMAVAASGVGDTVYVSGIGGLSAYDGGALSGWIYQVNGETAEISCGSYPLRDGDRVEWEYTFTLGK